MAFGQPQGYPATARQMQQLNALVLEAGHVDLRDARGPLGLTQRQAGGKFTRDEADRLIARLEGEAEGTDQGAADAVATDEVGSAGRGDHPSSGSPPAPEPADRPKVRSLATDARDAKYMAAVRKIPTGLLAAELQRRGWIVVEP